MKLNAAAAPGVVMPRFPRRNAGASLKPHSCRVARKLLLEVSPAEMRGPH